MKSFVFLSLFLSAIAAAAEKPNILLIYADDLGWGELGCYGQEKIKTPHLDALATTGQRYTNFYSGSPVCSPSRNVLMTGRHTGGCDIQDLKRIDPKEGRASNELRGDWPLSAQAYLLPTALKKIGYDTAAFGKWGMGEFGTTGAPDKHGVDEFYGYTDQRICHTFYPAFLWHNGRKDALNDPEIPAHTQIKGPQVDDERFTGQKHASEEIMKHMLAWVDTRSGMDEPFFLYYAPLEPHAALQPPAKWVQKYPAEWDEKPYLGNNGYLPHSRPRAAYAAMISYMDDNVGKLLARLKEKGLDQNTIVIFSSDNGTTHDVGGVDSVFFNSVAGLKGRKGQMFEGGIRVPGIVSWPGKIPAGKSVDQPSYVADIMPTLCAITGADPGQPYGQDMSDVWLGKTNKLADRKPLVWTGGGYDGQVAVRMGDRKAIRQNLKSGAKAPPTLWKVFDLAKDRNETTDIAADHPEVIVKAKEILRAQYTPARGFPPLQIFE